MWIAPSGKVHDDLKGLILNLSRRYGTVDFEPHVTLIGGLEGNEQELAAKSEELARTAPFRVRLLPNPEHSDEYFKCVFLRCEKTPELAELNRMAVSLFGRADGPEFAPHLSLVYGRLGPTAREEIVRELAPGFAVPVEFTVSGLHFMLTDRHPAAEIRAFNFNREHSR